MTPFGKRQRGVLVEYRSDAGAEEDGRDNDVEKDIWRQEERVCTL